MWVLFILLVWKLKKPNWKRNIRLLTGLFMPAFDENKNSIRPDMINTAHSFNGRKTI